MHSMVEQKNTIPFGWLAFTPMVQHSFKFGTVKVMPFEDRFSGFVESSGETVTQFGALMQTIEANDFVGKNVSFVGIAKVDKSETQSEMFLEVNDELGRLIQSASFEAITSQDWQHFALKLFVPSSSATISFGGLLRSTGELLFNSMEFNSETQTEGGAGALQFLMATTIEMSQKKFCKHQLT